MKLGEIISFEVGRITILEDSTIHVDISLGYALKVLSTLLYQVVMHEDTIRLKLLRSYKAADV